jgi:hypothetical protein
MIDTIAAVAIGGVIAVVFLYRGFFCPPGAFGSWAMFSHIVCYRINLVNLSTGERISPWDYELHQDYFGNTADIASLVEYLREEHGIVAVGDGVVAGHFGYLAIEVRKEVLLRDGVAFR